MSKAVAIISSVITVLVVLALFKANTNNNHPIV
jgi:hypothetical protein